MNKEMKGTRATREENKNMQRWSILKKISIIRKEIEEKRKKMNKEKKNLSGKNWTAGKNKKERRRN